MIADERRARHASGLWNLDQFLFNQSDHHAEGHRSPSDVVCSSVSTLQFLIHVSTLTLPQNAPDNAPRVLEVGVALLNSAATLRPRGLPSVDMDAIYYP